jgi:hypothetical protein
VCISVSGRACVRVCVCVCVHLAYETLTSTYIMCFPYGIFCASTHTYTHLPKFMCMRVVNAYVCVHRHVHTRMRIFLIQNTHLPIACIRMLYVYVCACVCIHKYTHVYKYRLFSSIKYTLICVCIPLMCVKVSRYICVHTYTEIHVCIRVVYMYVCVHAHVHTRIRST